MLPIRRLSIGLLSVFAAGTLIVTPPATQAKSDAGSTAARIELGRRLFMDPTVSRAGKFSCASCHLPEHGFSDPRTVSVDENGRTSRHSQTIADLADGTGFHWDGEFDYLHELLTARLAPNSEVMVQTRELLQRHFNVAESRGDRPSQAEFQKRMATLTPPYYGPDVPVLSPRTPVPQPLVYRLKQDRRYAASFENAYGSAEPTTDRIVTAMRAYMLSVRTEDNRYDRYIAGQPDALTANERRGLHLFEGKAGCASCHPSRPAQEGQRATFTDYAYRNTGVAFRSAKVSFRGSSNVDAGLGKQTFAGADIGRFKVPSLRDVSRRAPYMHDGSFKTLESVVDYYEHGGTTNGRIDKKVRAFKLTDSERADLVAFLNALTSEQRAGLGKPLRTGDDRVAKLRLMAPTGRPLRAVPVKITPFGDRLAGSRSSKEPIVVSSDAYGYITFNMPLWTHVKLSANGYEIAHDRPIPDTVGVIELLTVPRNKVYVEAFPSRGKKAPHKLVGKTQPNQQGEAAIEFRRVRRTKSGATLYVAERPKSVKRLLVSFDLGAGNAPGGLREIDTTGGIAEPLDYRAE